MPDLAELRQQLDELTGANLEGVLIVEDDLGFAAYLKRVLEAMRYQVTCVETGEATLEVTCPLLAIVDLRLPGMNGIEAIQTMRERCPATQFIIVTNYADTDTAIAAAQMGVRYFRKGQEYHTNLRGLLDAVYEATHRRPQ